MYNFTTLIHYRQMRDYDDILFNIKIASGQPRPGALLVAEPFLREQHFAHTVILLIDYAPASPSMGVVLNRLTAYTLQGLISGVEREDPIQVYCGGPMSCDRLFFIHTLGEAIPGSREVAPGVYIGGELDAVLDYINAGLPLDGYVRFFVGYSGWSPMQLDEELRDHVWAVTDPIAPDSLLKGSEDKYWHRFVRKLGSPFRGWLFQPQNPHNN